MADRVDIPLDSMEDLNEALKSIIVEFEDAGRHGRALTEAIDRPLGDSSLRDAADDFEGKWDDKRDTLKGHLIDLQEQVEGVRDAWEQFDADLAAELEQD